MRVGTLYAVLRLETGAFDAALASSETKMSRFFGLIRGAAVIAASAILGIAGASVAAAAGFDKHMTEALAIMEGVTDEIRAQLEDVARQVAKTTTFSAKEAADAYYFLAAAGFTAAEAMELLPVVAKFAQASLIDMEESTERLAGIMTAFGMRTGDATKDMEAMVRVSDALVKGATLSLGTMEDLATALVTGTAQSFRIVGKDMEEALAVLMAFADQGIKGAAAGTALSIVMRELQTKAIKNADAFAQFGIKVFDASGEMRNMADIILDFERAMAGMTDEEKKNFLIKLGLTDRSNKFLLSLIGLSDEIRAYEAELRDAMGYTDKVAKKQLEAFTAQLTIMWHKIVDVGITIGKVLLPHLTEVVKKIGEWFDENNELFGQIAEKGVEAVRTFALWLENHLFPILKRIWGIIGDVAHQIRMWIVRLDGLTGAFGPVDRLLAAFTMGIHDLLTLLENNTIPLALLAIGAAIRILTAAMMANPIVALLTVLVTAIGLLHQAWNTNVGGIQDRWAEFVEWFDTEAMPVIQEGIEWFRTNIEPALRTAWEWFVNDALPAIQEGLRWLFEEGLPAVGEAISEFYEQNKEAFDRLFTWLTDEAIPDVIEGLRGFGEWFVDNGPLIAAILGDLLEVLGALFTVMLNVASWAIPILWEGLMTLMAPLGFLGEIVTIVGTIIHETFLEIKRIVETVSFAIGEAVRVAGEIWQGVVDEVQTRVDIFVGAWEEAGRLIGDVWEDIQEWAETAGGIVQGILDDIANAIYIVTDAIQDAIDAINGFIGAKAEYDSISGKTSQPPPKYLPPTSDSGGTTKNIPMLATGVRNFAGGFAVVGERGPELVALPTGSRVFDSPETLEILRGLGGAAQRKEYHAHLQVTGLIEAKDEYEVLRQLRRAARMMPFDTPMMESR